MTAPEKPLAQISHFSVTWVRRCTPIGTSDNAGRPAFIAVKTRYNRKQGCFRGRHRVRSGLPLLLLSSAKLL
jgi:hypothetical protein